MGETFYTCDKQVFWESAGAFFPHDNSLVSPRNSDSSSVRGLAVICLIFNAEGSCLKRCLCAKFFTSNPKHKVSTFFGTMRPPFSALWHFFFQKFQCPHCEFFSIFFKVPKGPPSIFLMFLQQNGC